MLAAVEMHPVHVLESPLSSEPPPLHASSRWRTAPRKGGEQGQVGELVQAGGLTVMLVVVLVVSLRLACQPV